MKKSTCLLAILISGLAIRSSAQIGSLDNSFNFNGKVTTNIGSDDGATDVAIQPDGKIVCVGYNFAGTNSKFAITRYDSAGVADATFGVNGVVTTDLTTGYDQAFAVALQADGKIVVGGMMWVSAKGKCAVVRYNADGTIDNTFGTSGTASFAIGTADCGVSDMVIQPDGKIVVVSNATIAAIARDMAIARLNNDGSLDATFGTGGITTVDFNNGNDYVFTLSMQSDGKFIMGGASEDALSSFTDFAAVRIDSTGFVDNTYGTNGIITANFGKPDEWASSSVIQPDGKYIIAGYSGSPYKIAMARYDVNGVLDPSFNNTGMLTKGFTTHDEANDITLDTAGNIVVAGIGYAGTNQNFLVSRFLTNGSVDSTFGNNGFVTTDFGNATEKANGVALQQDGKIVATGVSSQNFATARYKVAVNTGLIDFAAMNNQVMIYPNPVAENATLTYALNKADKITITLTDVQGKLIKTFIANQQQTAGEQQLDLSFPTDLPKGNYYVVISNGAEQFSAKLVK